MQSHSRQRLNCDQCCLNCDSYMDNCKIAAEVGICANNTKLEQSNLLCSKFAIRVQLHSRQRLNCDQCCLNCDPHAQAVQGCHHKTTRKIRKSPSDVCQRVLMVGVGVKLWLPKFSMQNRQQRSQRQQFRQSKTPVVEIKRNFSASQREIIAKTKCFEERRDC